MREEIVSSRLLAVAEVMASHSGIEVPEALRTFKGSMPDRRLARMDAAAEIMEDVVLEEIEDGLSDKLKGFSLLNVVASSDDDLEEHIGLSKAQIKKIRTYIEGKPARQTRGKAPRPDGEASEGADGETPGES